MPLSFIKKSRCRAEALKLIRHKDPEATVWLQSCDFQFACNEVFKEFTEEVSKGVLHEALVPCESEIVNRIARKYFEVMASKQGLKRKELERLFNLKTTQENYE
jgi:hypothetical protein